MCHDFGPVSRELGDPPPRSDVNEVGTVSRALGDPDPRSEANNRSGATNLALSLANWATRLSENGNNRLRATKLALSLAT